MNKPCFRRTLPIAAALAVFAAAPAWAAAPTKPAKAKAFVHPELKQAKAHAAKLRAEYQAARKRLGAQAGPEDVTPPALTAFSVEGSVNLRKRGEQGVVSWTLSDDLSGGYYFYAQVTGPSGQVTVISRTIAYTDTAWSDKEPLYLDQSAEPGAWTVTYAWAYDLRGNGVEYDAAALAALGNTTLQVKNRSFDASPPALVIGEILTPTVTLSKNPPGNPYSFGDDLKARVTVADSAVGAVTSGVNGINLYFCKWEADNCYHAITLALDVRLWGVVQANHVLGQRLTPGSYAPGVYTMYSANVHDNAGNWQQYTNINHGGETDFTTLFPNGHSFEVLP